MTQLPVQSVALTNPLRSAQATPYDLAAIRDEARSLVRKGVIDRQQPIYALCCYIPGRDWVCVELELERNNYLLRDRIVDLLGQEEWEND